MKIFILLSLFGYLSANHYKLKNIKIQEGSELVKEKVYLDKKHGVAIAHTGKHLGRKGVTEMVDSAHGYVASKFDKDDGDRLERLCLIRKFDPKVDETASQAEQGMKKTHNKMPNVVVEIKQGYVLEEFVRVSSLPKIIRRFCSGRKIVKEKLVKSSEEASKLAIKEAIAAKKNGRKRVIVRSYSACSASSVNAFNNCPPQNIAARCRIRRSSCTYWVTCPLSISQGGFNCKGVHKLSSIFCCDYYCNRG